MEGHGFAQDVGIGREINGEVVLKVAAMLIEGGEEFGLVSRRQCLAAEVPEPDPAKGAKGDFQRAGPIHAALKRVCDSPTGKLFTDGFKVGGLRIQAPGLGK